jgi:uncharacterized phage protein (TIGR02220 family)
MELIKFLRHIRHLKDNYKLMWIDIITQSVNNNKISIHEIMSKYKMSRTNVYSVFNKNNKPIIVNNYVLNIEIERGFIIIKKSKQENEVELTTKNKSIVEYVLNMLNQTTGKNYKISNQSYRNAIVARINEGYNSDDFEKVIYIKSLEWIGTDNEKHLRPQTIFGNKMDGYLNQPIPKSNRNQNKLEKINSAIQNAKNFDWQNLKK